jgi:hypothetical protein
VLVPQSKAHHGPDKSVDRAMLAHVPKAQHDTMDFYSGHAAPFSLSCYVPGSIRRAMNNPMT